MHTQTLIDQIKKKKSLLCVGLDTDPAKLPHAVRSEEDPVFAFNKAIIDATHSFAVAYKPNLAFYESQGLAGWKSLQKTMEYLNSRYPELFTIADAKRGDIGNTATQYAQTFFETFGFDSVTVAPYMGRDSVEPFLAFEDKHTILLALTSNPGAFDFQTLECEGEPLYQKVLKTSQTYKGSERLMYVVGATKNEFIREIRALLPTSIFLVPGVGAQGGDVKAVCEAGLTSEGYMLINSSRGILYASSKEDFAEAAAAEARKLQAIMATYL